MAIVAAPFGSRVGGGSSKALLAGRGLCYVGPGWSQRWECEAFGGYQLAVKLAPLCGVVYIFSASDPLSVELEVVSFDSVPTVFLE